VRTLDHAVVDSVVRTMEQGRLFRYDCADGRPSATALLERDFAAAIGARYAVAVNSCSSGLFLSLLACGIAPGDEVLVPAFTFIAVPSAVVHAGCRPVLVETTEDYAIDLDDLEAKITPRTRALLLSYMRGYVPDLDRVVEICDRHGLVLVEDVAHGLGQRWDGVPLGRFGRVAAFSFQSYKLLDGGEGGMIVTDDREVALRAILLAGCYDRNWQWHFLDDDDRSWLDQATNSLPALAMRMSNLTAAALLPQVPCIEDRAREHNERFERVAARLAGAPIRIPGHAPKLEPVRDSLQFQVELEPGQRATFVERCGARGLPLQIFGIDPTNARCFWNWTFAPFDECPRTRALLMRTADMPLPLWVDESVLEYFTDAIGASLDEARSA
jgi:dTDP-4-amino-4,6-dideoxygalactose transaminase